MLDVDFEIGLFIFLRLEIDLQGVRPFTLDNEGMALRVLDRIQRNRIGGLNTPSNLLAGTGTPET